MATVRDYKALLSGSYFTGTATKAPVVITYSFDTKPQDYLDDMGYSSAAISSFRALTASDQQIARQAMSMISQVSGVEFVRVGAGQGDVRLVKMDFNQTSNSGAAGFAYYPGRTIEDDHVFSSDVGADVFLNTRTEIKLHLLLHEIGHAIGLKHPFEGDTVLASEVDNTGNTVMSYTGAWQSKLGRFDVEALRHIYGSAAQPTGTLVSHGYKDGIVSQTWGSASSTIAGTASKDNISAGSGNDKVAGFEGNDLLSGGSGSDTLFGGKGNDVLRPGSGNDMVYGGSQAWDGGEGNDTVDYKSFLSAITVQLESTYDWDAGAWIDPSASGSGIGKDKLFSIENVTAGGGADKITGDSVANVLRGNGGKDTIYGRGGNDQIYGDGDIDFLYGEAGQDKLFGGTNNDQLFGGLERDWLDGGTGSDTLTGNEGEDFFIYSKGYRRDTVTDFENDVDTIKLDSDLWSGAKSVSKVVDQFCKIKDGDAVFDFGNGDVLTLLDVASLSVLKNDILIV